jgi:hypothetical protein
MKHIAYTMDLIDVYDKFDDTLSELEGNNLC